MNGVVLISGRGSNLQSIIDKSSEIDLVIKSVISNNPDAYGLKRAIKANIPTHVIDHKKFDLRIDFDQELINVINKYNPEIIILAGFMRILTDIFINTYQGKILNIHPSLLPKYPGLNTHQKAIDAKDNVHGASVHFVTTKLDGGPVVAQKTIKINHEESSEALAKRVLKKEYELYPKVIHWYTQGKLKLINETTATLCGQII